MNLKETESEGVDWINLAQDRLQWRTLTNMAMKIRIPQKERNFSSSRGTGSFSRRTLLQ
jgi:hypothetical protein